VDRDQQRRNVTDLAARLVAQEGVSALTFRRVAGAASTSTAIVSTYFADKRDLLVSTLRAAAARTTVRFESAVDAGGDLRACLEAWLPLDDERLTDWRVIIAFWGAAATEPDLAQVQDGHVSRARGRVEKLLTSGGHRRGTAALAQQIVALTLGIAVQAVFDPAGPVARRQRVILRDGLNGLLGAIPIS
jgi:AcrR family transcriptional regulator